MRKIYITTLLLLLTSTLTFGQCSVLLNATTGIFLDYQSTNLLNCSGVAYNPISGRYYGVRAGNASYPLETWSATGTQLFTTNAGFDWRGMWWNPNTNALEGNGYLNSGIWQCTLDGNSWATNTGNLVFTGYNQPDAQSVGDYDPSANEILYYLSGNVYRYSRATNLFLGSYPLVGIPVALTSINNTTLMYTGCAGKEIAILNHVNKRVYFFDKSSGNYAGTSQLPTTAVTSSTFRTSYANGYVWLFNLSLGNWYSYRVLDVILPESAFDANAIWFSSATAQVEWNSYQAESFERFEVDRSLDGSNFETIGQLHALDIDHNTDSQSFWSVRDEATPGADLVYYRVKAFLKSGEMQSSEVLVLQRALSTKMQVTAWPVPANDHFQVRIENVTEGSSLEIHDAAGKTIHSRKLDAASLDTGTLDFETQSWANGIYLMDVKDLKGELSTQRVVIQH